MGRINTEKNSENGNILFTAILVLFAMNLLAITLAQRSTKEYNVATFQENESTNFYLTGSCINEIIGWFEDQQRPPNNLPYTITKANISHLYSGSESSSSLTRLGKYSYNCSTDKIIAKTTEARKVNVGENVAIGTGYGESGDLNPDYYYEITSNSSGPNNTAKRINSVVLVNY